jgi:hypothetical protein
MAHIIFGSLLLGLGVIIGLYWAILEDKRREKEKVNKMNIPKEIDESLDEWERKIS